MGNNVAYEVVGIGTIKIKMFDRIVRTLTDVRLVLELKKNLISLSTLNSINRGFKAEGGALRVCKGALVVMKEKKKMAFTSFKEARL